MWRVDVKSLTVLDRLLLSWTLTLPCHCCVSVRVSSTWRDGGYLNMTATGRRFSWLKVVQILTIYRQDMALHEVKALGNSFHLPISDRPQCYMIQQ